MLFCITGLCWPHKHDARGRILTGLMLHRAGCNRPYAPSGRFARMAYEQVL
jgi:hypothetical protein